MLIKSNLSETYENQTITVRQYILHKITIYSRQSQGMENVTRLTTKMCLILNFNIISYIIYYYTM